jgi:hypothetical protein
MMFLWPISPPSSRRRATRSRGNGRSLVSRGRSGPARPVRDPWRRKDLARLGLGKPPNDRPLYVGKAEDSLVARDVKTHFGDGRTGQSTVRRSFAALLHDELGLRGIPRNTEKPGYSANYGLSAAHEAVLTRSMRERLMLAVWSKPADCTYALAAIEAVLLAEWQPPLNLQGIVTPWTARLKSARAVMAEEARTWNLAHDDQ